MQCRNTRSIKMRDLNAITYIDVFGQQLVGHSVLVQDVIIDRCAGKGGAEEEAEYADSRQNQGLAKINLQARRDAPCFFHYRINAT